MRDEDIAIDTPVEVGIVGMSVFQGERGHVREIDTSRPAPRYRIDFEGFKTDWSFEAVELKQVSATNVS